MVVWNIFNVHPYFLEKIPILTHIFKWPLTFVKGHHWEEVTPVAHWPARYEHAAVVRKLNFEWMNGAKLKIFPWKSPTWFKICSYLEDPPGTSKWLVTPFITHLGHLEGVQPDP